MNEEMINGVFAVTVPEGFHVMDEEELKRIYAGQSPDRWCLRNDETGMTISVMWGRISPILAAIVNLDATAARTQEAMARHLQDFRRIDDVSPQIAGQKSRGFCYEYTTDGQPYVGEWLVMRYKKFAYTISYYAKNSGQQAAWEIFDALLDSIRASGGEQK